LDSKNPQQPNPAQLPTHLTRIQELQEQIADLKKRWPAHSIPPALLEQLDELEEELDKETQQKIQEDQK
jgi:hypothetical protein